MNELNELCRSKGVLVAAHQGLGGANIPANTIPAFELAVRNGAAVLEMDLFKTADGELFIFHTGKERLRLRLEADVRTMTARQVRELRFINADGAATHYGLDAFDDVLEHFRGRCLMNLDRCGGFLEDVARCVDRHGMREQILLKTDPSEERLAEVEAFAPEYMYLPVYKETDTATERIRGRNIHMVGAELVFAREDSPIACQEYIDSMRRMGMVLWVNTLIYNENVPLSAGHNDDVSLLKDPDDGWGWAARKGFGIIQTDWTAQCAEWLKHHGFSY